MFISVFIISEEKLDFGRGEKKSYNTMETIDYESYLKDASLYVDTASWSICRVEDPTPEQRVFLEHLDMI